MKREKQEKMTYETPQLEVFEVEVEKVLQSAHPIWKIPFGRNLKMRER